MGTRRTANVRRLLAALVLVVAPVVSHVTAPRAAAILMCGHAYCGALTISMGGPGNAEVVSDPAGVDCSWNGATKTYSGTCSATLGWDDSPSTYVDLSLIPTASSYVCVGQSCAGAGQTVGTSVVLDNQAGTTFSVGTGVATALTIWLNPSGDGSGRITSNPAGLDCRAVSGTTSGTCSHTWYAKGSISIDVTYTPDSGSAYCSPTCLPVGTPHTLTRSATVTAEYNLTDGFGLGHPIATVAVQGQGKVTSTPAGISCPSTCSSYYPPATSLNLTATPATGYVFAGWSGACAAAGTVTTCPLALGSSDISTTAVFAKQVTPPPPTATPRPGTTAGPTPIANSATPRPSVAAPSAAASTSAEGPSAAPVGSNVPAATSDPRSAAPVALVGESSAPGTGPGAGPAADGETGIGGVVTGLVVGLAVVLVLVLGVGAGFLAGRRRRAAKP